MATTGYSAPPSTIGGQAFSNPPSPNLSIPVPDSANAGKSDEELTADDLLSEVSKNVGWKRSSTTSSKKPFSSEVDELYALSRSDANTDKFIRSALAKTWSHFFDEAEKPQSLRDVGAYDKSKIGKDVMGRVGKALGKAISQKSSVRTIDLLRGGGLARDVSTYIDGKFGAGTGRGSNETASASTENKTYSQTQSRSNATGGDGGAKRMTAEEKVEAYNKQRAKKESTQIRHVVFRYCEWQEVGRLQRCGDSGCLQHHCHSP